MSQARELWKWTDGATALAVIAALALILCAVRSRGMAVENAATQASIEQTVASHNKLGGEAFQTFREVSAILNPLTNVLRVDAMLEERGANPLPAREFVARLSEGNRRAIASHNELFIDTCAQFSEVEKHLLYQGLHGPVRALPGWAPSWRECMSILAPPPPLPF